MENEVLTFGEFLYQLIKGKEFTITKLARLTETKSRTAIDRLLNDMTSIKVIEAFASKLILTCELGMLPQEIDLLKQSVEVSRVGKDIYIARKILLGAVENKLENNSPCSDKALIEVDGHIISQQDYFQMNSRYAHIEFLVVGACFAPFVYNYLKFNTSSSVDTYVEHIYLFGNKKSEIADAFISMYKLLNYDNYEPLYYESEENILEFAALKKTDIKGNQSTDVLIVFQDDFLLFNDNPGNTIFNFSNILYQKIKNKSKNIKLEFGKKDPLDDLTELSEFHYNLEKNSDEYFIKHNFCTQMIPQGILYQLASEIDYQSLGYSNFDSRIQEIVTLYVHRCRSYYTVQKEKIHIFTKRGLLDFAQTGCISDHFVLFRPLTKEEIKKTLEFNLKQLETNPYLMILLLKDNFTLGNISVNYYNEKYLCLFEESSGYGKNYFDVRINAAPIIEVFDDFIENMLLRNLVYPQSETIKYLKYLISTLD